MRDKLAELIGNAPIWKSATIDDACMMIADHLIANGVTFATDNNVGCKYCKEDKDGYRVMFGAFSIHNPFHGNIWEIDAGRCKPRQIYFCPMCGRKLSEPPKEGE